jgi:hypothetical protein
MLVADSLPGLSRMLYPPCGCATYFTMSLLYLGLVTFHQTAPQTNTAAEDLS